MESVEPCFDLKYWWSLFPISSTYGRFTWVISINANGDYNVNPPCLNGKIDPLVFHQETECLHAFIRDVLYCNREDRQVFTDRICFVQFLLVIQHDVESLLRRQQKPPALSPTVVFSDIISRGLLYGILMRREDGPYPKELTYPKELASLSREEREHRRSLQEGMTRISLLCISLINKNLLIFWETDTPFLQYLLVLLKSTELCWCC